MSEENNEQVVENTESVPAMLAPGESIIAPVEVPVEAEPVLQPEPVFEPVPVFEPAPHIVEEALEPMPDANVITAPSFPVAEVPAVGIVADGVIGSTVTKVEPVMPKPSKKSAPKEETVAIFSTKNVTWSEVGKVYRGYNIVAKSAADKWLTRNHVRLATPEEVAKEFGK